jgi:hypothetical protein
VSEVIVLPARPLRNSSRPEPVGYGPATPWKRSDRPRRNSRLRGFTGYGNALHGVGSSLTEARRYA